MNKFILVLTIFFSFLLAHDGAEEGHHHDRSPSTSGFIEGVVVNADTGEGIEYASVSIYALESEELVTGLFGIYVKYSDYG